MPNFLSDLLAAYGCDTRKLCEYKRSLNVTIFQNVNQKLSEVTFTVIKGTIYVKNIKKL